MPDPRTVTGHSIVMVKLADGGEVVVRRGEGLPTDMAEGEPARLEKVGAFAPPPVADLEAQGARHAKAQASTPQATLAANPETPGPKLATADASGELGAAGGPAPPPRAPKAPAPPKN